MRTLDEQERSIVRYLIRHPRASDNEIGKATKIPVTTVNRKRKKLEEEKLLRYYVSLDKGEFGLHIFDARQLYIIKMRIGITRKEYIQRLEMDSHWQLLNSRYISWASLGEQDGRLALIIILDAPSEQQLVDEFNGRIVPYLREKLGADCIEDVNTANINKLVRVHHNYLPAINMERGVIKKDWPDDLIFVDGSDTASTSLRNDE